MKMASLVIAAAASLALTGGVALADSGGAIANSTTTSMAAPIGSPGLRAPRSAAIPGVAPQLKEAQGDNAAAGRGVEETPRVTVRPPTNPVTGRAQVTP